MSLGIIGAGNMGGSIAAGASSSFRVSVFDKDKQKAQSLCAANPGIKHEEALAGLLNDCAAVILAVKPQDFDALLAEIKPFTNGKLVLSIAAGITTGYIEGALGEARVVRVMPNMGVKIRAAQTSLARGKYAAKEDMDFAKELFGLLGKVWVLDEDMMDSATAISGSGPAYVFYDMEANNIDPESIPVERKNDYVRMMKQAAVDVGFDANTALDMAASTVASSIRLLIQTGISPAQLRKMVTSPKGTTEAAINVLSGNGSWSEAALAARKRARELSRRN